MSSKKLKTALLHCSDAQNSYYYDWQQAFMSSELYECDNYNLYRLDNVDILKKKIKDYDLIVALHSSNGWSANLKFNFPYIPILQQRKGRLVMFIGNEVNISGDGDRLYHRLKLVTLLKPEYIATQLPIENARKLYSDFDTQVIEITHGLNPGVFKPMVKQAERKIDFGIRTGRYPTYLGDNDRNLIIDFFVENAAKYGLVIDINTDASKKLGPEEWCGLLNSCRGTIGNESGGYFLEKDDHTAVEIRKYVYEKLSLKDPFIFTFLLRFFATYHERLNYKFLLKAEHYLKKILPASWKKQFDSNVAPFIDYNFEEIYTKFYKDYKAPLNGRAISSRHFDAIGAKACQVMLKGHFNGILKADEHYIALEKDFSNMDEVMRKFKDLEFREKMVDHTYDYVMSNHTLDHRVRALYAQLT